MKKIRHWHSNLFKDCYLAQEGKWFMSTWYVGKGSMRRPCMCTHIHEWRFLQSLSALFTEAGLLTSTCLPTALLRGYPVSDSWYCMCSQSLLISLKVLGIQILVLGLGWELFYSLNYPLKNGFTAPGAEFFTTDKLALNQVYR